MEHFKYIMEVHFFHLGLVSVKGVICIVILNSVNIKFFFFFFFFFFFYGFIQILSALKSSVCVFFIFIINKCFFFLPTCNQNWSCF